MAGYYRKSAYGKGKYGNRRGRRSWSSYSSGRKYSSRRLAKGKKSSATMGRATLKSLQKRLDEVTMTSRHGSTVKMPFMADPGKLGLPANARESSRPFFVVPVAEMLRQACGRVRRSALWVTGISLELDVVHSSMMDFMALCGPAPLAVAYEMPLQVGQESLFAVGRVGEKFTADVKPALVSEMWTHQHPRVASLADAALENTGRDQTMFTAPLKRSANVVAGTVQVNAGKVAAAQKKISLDLTPWDAKATWTRNAIRMYWSVGKTVTVCDANTGQFVGDQYSIVCGVRRQVERDGTLMSPGGGEPRAAICGQIENIKVTVHVRL